MSVLVTGADGYIGRHVLAAIRDCHTVGLDWWRSAHERAPLADHYIQMDVADEALGPLLIDCDVGTVIHLAAHTSIEDSLDNPETYREDAHKAEALARTCEKYGVPRLIYASSAAVYGEAVGNAPMLERSTEPRPISPYGKGKLLAEELMRKAHPNVAVLRLFNVTGHGNIPCALPGGFIRAVCDGVRTEGEHGVIPLYGDGEIVRDWVHVDDVVTAIMRMLAVMLDREDEQKDHWDEPAMNVCTGRGIALIEIIHAARRLWGGRVRVDYREERPPGQPWHLVGSTYVRRMRLCEPDSQWPGDDVHIMRLLKSTMSALEAEDG